MSFAETWRELGTDIQSEIGISTNIVCFLNKRAKFKKT